jgi:hypothetical protein
MQSTTVPQQQQQQQQQQQHLQPSPTTKNRHTNPRCNQYYKQVATKTTMKSQQDHLMKQDAATVDPAKLTALSPEVVRFYDVYHSILFCHVISYHIISCHVLFTHISKSDWTFFLVTMR